MKNLATIAIVDDHRNIRELIADLLTEESRFKCIGLFPDAITAIRELPELKPDIVLMDINMPGINGIECIQKLKPLTPTTNFIVLTVYNEADYIFDALSAGAVGYLLKRSIADELIPALNNVVNGGSPMNGEIARKVVLSFQSTKKRATQTEKLEELSARETEVLNLLGRGRLFKEIADELGISLPTVNTYIRRIYEKLHVHSRAEAVAKLTGMH